MEYEKKHIKMVCTFWSKFAHFGASLHILEQNFAHFGAICSKKRHIFQNPKSETPKSEKKKTII